MLIKNNRDFLKHLKKSPQDFFIIHYSSQGLFETPDDGLSPKITSIAITNYSKEQTISFSTHAIAAELGIVQKDVIGRFDEIELELLHRFYEFIKEHKDKFWVHWNMKSLTYGFEHLEHRYSALAKKNAEVIPAEQRINLDNMLKIRYGDEYVASPRMLSLMEINGGRHRNFLTGKEEAKAFEENKFARMHQSTLVKVEFFCWVIKKMSKGKLKTDNNQWEIWIEKFLDSVQKKIATLLFNLLLGFFGIWEIIRYIISL